MKLFIILIIIGLSVAVIGGVHQKSEAEYARDEFVTELIYKGLSKEKAIRVVNRIPPDTLLLWMNSPEALPINDSTAMFQLDGVQRYFSDNLQTGFLLVVYAKVRLQEEKNGGLGEVEWALRVKQIPVFKLESKAPLQLFGPVDVGQEKPK